MDEFIDPLIALPHYPTDMVFRDLHGTCMRYIALVMAVASQKKNSLLTYR